MSTIKTNREIKVKLLKKLIEKGYTVTTDLAESTKHCKVFTIHISEWGATFNLVISDRKVVYYALPLKSFEASRGICVVTGGKFGFNRTQTHIDLFNELIGYTIDALDIPRPTIII